MKKSPKVVKKSPKVMKSIKLSKETISLLNSSDLPNVVGAATRGATCAWMTYCCEW